MGGKRYEGLGKRMSGEMKHKLLLGNGPRGQIRGGMAEILGLEKDPWRVRILTLNFIDFELFRGLKLGQIIKRLATKGIITTIIVGNKPKIGDEKYQDQVDFYDELSDEGVQIYHNDRVHAKVILAEGRKENSALIMTANLTKSGFYYKYEAGVLLPHLENGEYKSLRNYTNDIIGTKKTKPIGWVI